MSQLAQPDDECKSDMTPMIDVVFLLIVFFICIDFKVLESKLEAWLPTDRGSSPEVVTPEEQLIVRVHVATPGTTVYPDGEATVNSDRPKRYRLLGHTVRFEVGAHSCNTLDDAKRELTRIASDANSMIPDRQTGGRKLMACVVEGFPGTRYDDVSRAADICHTAGFQDIHFGGCMGALPSGR